MDYFEYSVQCKPDFTEILIAFFSEWPFDSFETVDTGFNAYIPAGKGDLGKVDEAIDQLKSRFDFNFRKEFIESQNWNSIWEANFEPIVVGSFCGIRADFHDRFDEVRHEIIINPKMAFGTGHHATTYMVIEMMEKLDFIGKKVLDYGCGTGVLAILAGKLGARDIQAVDIEAASYENTLENAKINAVTIINALHGTLANIEETTFDIILANINRNVILDSFPALYNKLLKNGKLIVSGIIKKDEHILIENAENAGFSAKETRRKNNWVCMLFVK